MLEGHVGGLGSLVESMMDLGWVHLDINLNPRKNQDQYWMENWVGN